MVERDRFFDSNIDNSGIDIVLTECAQLHPNLQPQMQPLDDDFINEICKMIIRQEKQ